MREWLRTIVFWCVMGMTIALLSSCGSSGGDAEVDPDAPTYTVTVELYDAQTGIATNSISEGNPGLIRITVTKYDSEEVVANAYIVLTTTKGSFRNSDGTGLTDSQGQAEFTLEVEAGDVGAGQISFEIEGEVLDTLFTFSIGAPDSIKLGSFQGGVFLEGVLLTSLAAGEELSVGASTTITAELAVMGDSGVYEAYDSDTAITFASRCAEAVLGDTKYMGNGRTITTYSGGSCGGGIDKVTATGTLSGTTLSASVEISNADPAIGSIEFVSADPEVIALSGSANSEQPSTSTVTFLVKDVLGNPVADATVSFSLTTTKGGLSLAPASSKTDTNGNVSVIVTSGNVATSVRVKATITLDGGTTISAESSNLVVSTGLPDQNSFSLSAEVLNPEGWNYDGVTVPITIRAADHFNNPVPDGTTIYFTTEGGAIDDSCSTRDGGCSVNWISQNFRPANGRVTILATAIGEESFTDNNGNGLFETDPSITDSPDTLLTDMPEAFLDIDEDGVFDTGIEEFFDFNNDNKYTIANGLYNGSLCNDPVSCTTDLIDVRDDLVVVMSTSFAVITFSPSSVTFSDENDFELITITVADQNGNSMPNATTVEITAPENSTIGGETSFSDIIASTTEPVVYSFYIQPEETYAGGEVDFLEVEVLTPFGNTTKASLQVNYPAYPADTNLTASFKVTISGLKAVFQDTSTSDVDIVAWDWDFGDGRTSTNQNTERSYTNAGSYVVSLTVRDASGAEDTTSQTITVSEPAATP